MNKKIFLSMAFLALIIAGTPGMVGAEVETDEAMEAASPEAAAVSEDLGDDKRPVFQTAPVIVKAEQLGSTGMKMNVPLRDIPSTVNVIKKETLLDQGANEWLSAMKNAPGVYPSQNYGAFSTITMRGLNSKSTVLLRNGNRDDSWKFSTSTPISEFSNVERIEVLKGPQGVLLGEGALAGAVNIITKQPTETTVAELVLSGGDFGYKRQSFGIGGPLDQGSKLLYRVDAGFTSTEGWRDNGFALFNASMTLDWKVLKSTTIRLHASRAVNHWDGDVGLPLLDTPGGPYSSSDIAATGQILYPGVNLRDHYNSAHDFLKSQDSTYLIEVLHQLNSDMEVKAKLAAIPQNTDWRSSESFSITDTAATPGVFDHVFMDHFSFQHNREPLIFETTLTWDREGLVKEKIQVGLEYLRYKNRTPSVFTGQGTPVMKIGQPWAGVSDTETMVAYTRESHTNMVNASVFFQDLIEVTEMVKVLLGARYTSFNRIDRRDTLAGGFTTAYGLETTYSAQDASWRGGLILQPVDWLTAYGSFSTAFLPPTVTSNDGHVLASESGHQTEVGLRYEQDRHSLNLAVFQINHENTVAQINTASPANYRNLNGMVSKGVEIDGSVYPLEGLEVSGGYAVVDAQWKEFKISGVDLTGRRPRWIPDATANVWTSYRTSSGWGVGGGMRYISEIYRDHEEKVAIPSYIVGDVALFGRLGEFELRVNVKNVADHRDYFISTVPNVMPGQPRETMVTVTRNW